MADVSEGYYYDPAFSMEELNTLSRLETMEAWHQRQMEIRNRERFEEVTGIGRYRSFSFHFRKFVIGIHPIYSSSGIGVVVVN
jgi:hypothetical protein